MVVSTCIRLLNNTILLLLEFLQLINTVPTFCNDWFSIVWVSQRTDRNTSNALLDLFHCVPLNFYMKTNVGKYDKRDLTFIQTTAVCYL